MVFQSTSIASHIVGGELEFLHVADNRYTINLILYFDRINGNPDAEDQAVTVYIYRKSDERLLSVHTLLRQNASRVDYSIPDCAISQLVTDRILYTTDVVLAPENYDDPEGYYIVWERCCRNVTISNIVDPDDTGQTFLLWFPPLIKDGERFINSSPSLFPPLQDYACVDQFYFSDFAGFDADGDSLAYSLVTPLNSSQFTAIPIPSPPEHPRVTWSEGININNVIPGNPTLAISEDGLLTVTPSSTGLFVFSVLVREYRDGLHIGEVRRDFQLFSITCPDPGDPPNLIARNPSTGLFTDDLGLINFAVEDEKCLELLVTDENQGENIRFLARPVNFNAGEWDFFTTDAGFLASPTDTLRVDMCFPDCPFIEGPMILDLVAFDDACPQGLLDSMRVAVEVEAPANLDPYFVSTDKTIEQNLIEGDVYSLNIDGRDNDLDELVLTVITPGYELEDVGMFFSEEVHDEGGGQVTTTFTWDTGCDTYDFTEKTQFDLTLVLDDLDACDLGTPDTINLDLSVVLPPNTDPVVTSDLPTLELTQQIEDVIDFNLFASDSDGDFILLEGSGADFNFESYGVNFAPDSGAVDLTSPFRWALTCDNINLEVKDEFSFIFRVTDRDKCKFPNADSLVVNVKVLPPPNERPVLSYENRSEEVRIENGIGEIVIGERMEIDVLGNDIDNDNLVLELIEAAGDFENSSYAFETREGTGAVRSVLIWEPRCDELDDDFGARTVDFTFLLTDDECVVPLTDTLRLSVSIADLVTNQDTFIPPNVFTPNGDGSNDLFTLAAINFPPDFVLPSDMEIPDDNCRSRFENIVIYNRWGQKVFESTTREFAWNGKGEAAGVYYYYIKFTGFEINGIISLIL